MCGVAATNQSEFGRCLIFDLSLYLAFSLSLIPSTSNDGVAKQCLLNKTQALL
jgi:hypothetical protein